MLAARKASSGVAFAALVVTSLVGERRARAVEQQWHVGAGVGGSGLEVGDTMHLGVGFGLDATYGLTDQFNLVAEVQTSRLVPGSDPDVPHSRPSGLTSGAVGATYVLDVLRWVPYGGILLGGDLLSGGALPDAKGLATAQVALGLDYQLDRTWSVGVAAREHFYATSTYSSFTTLFLRVEYAWGW